MKDQLIHLNKGFLPLSQDRRDVKQKRPPRILAIDPGTRYLGYAVLDGKEWIRSGVKMIKERRLSPQARIEKAKRILLLLFRYGPDVLVIEKPFLGWSRRSPLLKAIATELIKLGRKENLPAYEYSPLEIRETIAQSKQASKMEIARIITTDYYPWLSRYYEREKTKSWYKEKYWLNMFDAIAAGLTYYQRKVISKNRSKVELHAA